MTLSHLRVSYPRSLCLLCSLSLLLLCIWNKSNVYMWLCSVVHMDKPRYPHSCSFPYSSSLNYLYFINLPCNLLLLIKVRHTVCSLRPSFNPLFLAQNACSSFYVWVNMNEHLWPATAKPATSTPEAFWVIYKIMYLFLLFLKLFLKVCVSKLSNDV